MAIAFELDWQAEQGDGPDYEIEIGAIAVQRNGKVEEAEDILLDRAGFRTRLNGALRHYSGRNSRTVVDLNMVPDRIAGIELFVSLYEAEIRGQSFDQLGRINLIGKDSLGGQPFMSCDIARLAEGKPALHFLTFDRTEAGWHFAEKSRTYPTLGKLLGHFGVSVS